MELKILQPRSHKSTVGTNPKSDESNRYDILVKDTCYVTHILCTQQSPKWSLSFLSSDQDSIYYCHIRSLKFAIHK